MKLTAEEHPEAIKRYEHVRPARGWKVRPCRTRCPGTRHTCTREREHRGPHVAHHGMASRVAAVWDGGPEDRAAEDARRRVADHQDRRDRSVGKRIGKTDGSPGGGPLGRSAGNPARHPTDGPGARRPVGLRTSSSDGVLGVAWRYAIEAFSSWDQVVFVVLFIVFVKFAIDVLMSLY